MGLEEILPPNLLYHGTDEKYVSSIDSEGLISKSRRYVHLSDNMETARKVGKRHGKPVIYQVNSKGMAEAGDQFYRSVNGV